MNKHFLNSTKKPARRWRYHTAARHRASPQKVLHWTIFKSWQVCSYNELIAIWSHFALFSDIYNKIDNDGDKLVTEKELKEWIQHVQNRYTEEDTDRQWADQKIDRETGLLDWEAYKDHTYGYLEREDIVTFSHCPSYINSTVETHCNIL